MNSFSSIGVYKSDSQDETLHTYTTQLHFRSTPTYIDQLEQNA
jgi:hypothetical protein